MIQRFAMNRDGRDFAVGDIHGYFTRLQEVLIAAGFNPAKDRLFCVGDLVDRGPECELALDWLAQPWFHAVRGNHEDYAIRYMRSGLVDVDTYRLNGGGWFLALPEERQAIFAAAFSALPYVIEVETRNGVVGILHADCPVRDWNDLPTALEQKAARMHTIWSRVRIESVDESPVANIYAVVAGHTPLREVMALGNVIHIDTAGWMDDGHFTLLNLAGIRW
ncbi:serine/threonine protein phosphatase [Candidimonas sp. SYP-B2681]|uniref:metallophosphoesterase n=1 Tax=Candidimonas sp. SYP-B2681 TaxID=2497686 RepID=UPI000F865FB8|nr:metallophosphoesterase [Candidimonas sp. SYP-B2681]RTZ47480.1 serine/threonine protein phosphatase [Candidimonas sp. SYP-B2681]